MSEPIRVEVVSVEVQSRDYTGPFRLLDHGPVRYTATLSPDSYAAVLIRLGEAADARDEAADPFDEAPENLAFFEALAAVRLHPDHKTEATDG